MKTNSLRFFIYVVPFILLCSCSNNPKFLKKELIEKDGVDYKWYLYYYLSDDDTLFAAFDLNDNRITPDYKKRPVYVHDSNEGIFMCETTRKDSINYPCYTGYLLTGKCVIPDSLNIRSFSIEDGDIILLNHYYNSKDDFYSAYNISTHTWVIPYTLKANYIHVNNDNNYICVNHTDLNGDKLYSFYSISGDNLIPTSLKTIGYSRENKYDCIVFEHEDETGSRIYSVYNYNRGEWIIHPSNKYNHIWMRDIDNIWCAYFYDTWGEDDPENRVVTYTYTDGGEWYVEGTYLSDGRYRPNYYFDLKAERRELYDLYKQPSAIIPHATTTRPPNTIRNSRRKSTGSSEKEYSSSISDNEEPGLLIKGPYTIVTDGIPEFTVIQVYEDYLKDGSLIFEYKSINTNGERIYSGDAYFNIFCTFYVNPETGNIRLIKRFDTPYGSSTVTCQVTKGEDLYIRGNFIPGGNPIGGYTPSSGNNEYQWQEHEYIDNPVQPHQRTNSCSLCDGSGKCSTCNGKHWYYSASGAIITCPNCNSNGDCSSCGGRGKKTSTHYY